MGREWDLDNKSSLSQALGGQTIYIHLLSTGVAPLQMTRTTVSAPLPKRFPLCLDTLSVATRKLFSSFRPTGQSRPLCEAFPVSHLESGLPGPTCSWHVACYRNTFLPRMTMILWLSLAPCILLECQLVDACVFHGLTQDLTRGEINAGWLELIFCVSRKYLFTCLSPQQITSWSPTM